MGRIMASRAKVAHGPEVQPSRYVLCYICLVQFPSF
jgi:hypothetical protein